MINKEHLQKMDFKNSGKFNKKKLKKQTIFLFPPERSFTFI
ncbi:hypothetical protein AsAng_0000550 [Aureispira anguillae]|uniref:Uncharacterized protein n=1 Tax=Aureispira anguillae TaxID=2864201 RepID=A0A915VJU2_9BACT|nr:hypothetical protein AsAng_0000550 [Aureispira anguillae]